MITLEFKRNDQVPDHHLNWPAHWSKFGAYPSVEEAEAKAEEIQAASAKWVFRIREQTKE